MFVCAWAYASAWQPTVAQDWVDHAQSIVRNIGMTAQVASRYGYLLSAPGPALLFHHAERANVCVCQPLCLCGGAGLSTNAGSTDCWQVPQEPRNKKQEADSSKPAAKVSQPVLCSLMLTSVLSQGLSMYQALQYAQNDTAANQTAVVAVAAHSLLNIWCEWLRGPTDACLADVLLLGAAWTP
jgi:hypothetical protein